MFKQRRNKRFNYKSRLENSKGIDPKDDLEAKWNEMRDNNQRRGSILTSLPALFIILGAIFVLIYILNKYI